MQHAIRHDSHLEIHRSLFISQVPSLQGRSREGGEGEPKNRQTRMRIAAFMISVGPQMFSTL